MSKPKIDLVLDCPGSWYGNSPQRELGAEGHVVIDPEKASEAMTWLKRRVHILGTKLTTDNGLFIRFQLRAEQVRFAD